MSSSTLDAQLRKAGYFLVQRRNVDGAYWFVGSVNTHNGWNCSNLVEVKTLRDALRVKSEMGGAIYHDGDAWQCDTDSN